MVDALDLDAIDELVIETGDSYFVARQYLLCLPRCQEGFDAMLTSGLTAEFGSLAMAFDHDALRATFVWVHATPAAAAQNEGRLRELVDTGAMAASGTDYDEAFADESVDVEGRLLVLHATMSRMDWIRANRDAADASGIFGHNVPGPLSG